VFPKIKVAIFPKTAMEGGTEILQMWDYLTSFFLYFKQLPHQVAMPRQNRKCDF
jgi:hypothetical protein